MKILITGVYGIVGKFLCNELKEENEIIGVGKKPSFNGCDKYYCCDITNYNDLKKVINKNKDLDFIIHCAALAHNKGNDLSFDGFKKVNFYGTKNLMDLSNKYLKLKNFIFISTISVYGERLEKEEYLEEEKCFPKSPYAVTKKMAEDYIEGICKSNYSILRLAPVYSENFLLNIVRRSKIKGIFYKVGKGTNKLSLCNIKNISEVTKYIIKNHKEEKKFTYNISDYKDYRYIDLLDFLNAKNIITIPKFFLNLLYIINKKFFKKQFIEENSIKLISNNLYVSRKIREKVNLKFHIKDVQI